MDPNTRSAIREGEKLKEETFFSLLFTYFLMEILLKNSGQEKNLYSNNDQQMGEWFQTPHLDFKGILQQPKYSFYHF